jgi:predicted pyridoxine 5'-phosphate oxidase superfamily flavin-nucleotide-binding protein
MTTSLASSAFDSLGLDAVPDQDVLRRVYELPKGTAIRKQMTELTEQARWLIGCSSLVLVAGADAEGNCDVSPRGGPAGFVSVLDARTVAIPDATGNRAVRTIATMAVILQ